MDLRASGADYRIPDAAILGKRALCLHGTHSDVLAYPLEHETVPRSDPKSATNLARHGNLPLACDLGLLLHAILDSLLYHDFLTLAGGLPLSP
jgi:hypothetical protein